MVNARNVESLVGKEVVLNKMERLHRQHEMRYWTGLVMGVKYYRIKEQDKTEEYPRLLVEWGLGKTWQEVPENVELAK